MHTESEQASEADATRVTVSYPPDMGDDGREFLEGNSFRRYLGNAWDELEPGAAFEEVVNLGCCTDAARVTLTVESVEGGTNIGPDTDIEYVEGDEPAGLGCDWRRPRRTRNRLYQRRPSTGAQRSSQVCFCLRRGRLRALFVRATRSARDGADSGLTIVAAPRHSRFALVGFSPISG